MRWFLLLASDLARGFRAVWRMALCDHKGTDTERIHVGDGCIVFRKRCMRCGAEVIQHVR